MRGVIDLGWWRYRSHPEALPYRILLFWMADAQMLCIKHPRRGDIPVCTCNDRSQLDALLAGLDPMQDGDLQLLLRRARYAVPL